MTAALTGCVTGFTPCNANALQYQRIPLELPKVAIAARGPIITGDFRRFGAFVRTLPSDDRVVGFVLDSPGGTILEAEQFAKFIGALDATVLVPSGAECSSACFLLFAAAARRLVSPDALIGVHSASEAGQETLASMAVTTAMARDAASLGVPPAVVGKLVETPPGRTTWLTSADLASMGVTLLNESPQTEPFRPSLAAIPPPSALPAQPLSSNSTDQQQKSPAYEQGAADRRAWETWFGGLSGASREGAEYWSAQRSLPKPGSCYRLGGHSIPDWTEGCSAAQRVLHPSDIRRKSEPDYRAGWNSL